MLVISARHSKGGNLFEWLVPLDKENELFLAIKKEYGDKKALALVENLDSVAIVEIVEIKKVEFNKDELLEEHPFKKAICFFTAEPSRLIVGYENFLYDDDMAGDEIEEIIFDGGDDEDN